MSDKNQNDSAGCSDNCYDASINYDHVLLDNTYIVIIKTSPLVNP